MKKIFLLLSATCALVACDPVHEDISNAGSITEEQLKESCVVTTDKAADGRNGNVISCETSAPVTALWSINGKKFTSNSAKRKMKLAKDESDKDIPTDFKVYLTALCADGSERKAEFTVNCATVTDELVKVTLYDEKPITPGSWTGGMLRFSDTEGQFFPTLSDEVYEGLTTLVFDISNATPDCKMMVNNGWWSATYYDGLVVKDGLFELPITEAIAADCAKGKGGKDLQVILTSGNCTINEVYYEE